MPTVAHPIRVSVCASENRLAYRSYVGGDSLAPLRPEATRTAPTPTAAIPVPKSTSPTQSRYQAEGAQSRGSWGRGERSGNGRSGGRTALGSCAGIGSFAAPGAEESAG